MWSRVDGRQRRWRGKGRLQRRRGRESLREGCSQKGGGGGLGRDVQYCGGEVEAESLTKKWVDYRIEAAKTTTMTDQEYNAQSAAHS